MLESVVWGRFGFKRYEFMTIGVLVALISWLRLVDDAAWGVWDGEVWELCWGGLGVELRTLMF